VDTSAWLAYMQPEEHRHKEVKKILTGFLKDCSVLCLSSDNTNEIITRLVYNIKKSLVNKFIRYLDEAKKEGSVKEFWVDESLRSDGINLVNKYFEHQLSLTDATSLAVMKRYNIKTIVSLDSDFKKVGAHTLPLGSH